MYPLGSSWGDIAEIFDIRTVSRLSAIELCLHSLHKIKPIYSWCWHPPRLPVSDFLFQDDMALLDSPVCDFWVVVAECDTGRRICVLQSAGMDISGLLCPNGSE